MTYYVLSALSAMLIAFGLYLILKYIYKTPTDKISKVIVEVSNLNKYEKESSLRKIFHNISNKFAHKIKLNESTRYKLQAALDYQHYKSSAEEHFIESLSGGVFIGLMTCILGFIHPMFLIVAIMLGFLMYKIEFEAPLNEMDKIRININNDSSLISKYIADSLKDGNRNVVEILSSCKNSLSNDYKKDLEITITELKTINQETALMNMSARINSPNVTQIVMGLLGVLRGDNQVLYFESLADKFYKEELTEIKKKNSLKPSRISRLSMVLLIAVVAQILVGLVLSLVDMLSSSGFLL